MNRCRRVGIDVTKRCNLRCRTCFYYWRQDFNTKSDKPLKDAIDEVTAAQRRGCDHAVLVGQGEPGLWPHLMDWLKMCRAMGVTTSIISNGTMSPDLYDQMYKTGLNHLHLSVHGIGPVLDEIVGVNGSGKRQAETIGWLKKSDLPWRMNVTLQQGNYKTLSDIAGYCMDNGCRHIVLLGFLPHYEWNDPTKMRSVAVDPRELEPYINAACKLVEERGVLLTVRYHPMCRIDPAYSKYIVNARYVLYDPWEWDYGHAGDSEEALWAAATGLGDSVSVTGAPCQSCASRMHCGGWNRVSIAGFPGCVEADEYNKYPAVPGGMHDANPANSAKGWF